MPTNSKLSIAVFVFISVVLPGGLKGQGVAEKDLEGICKEARANQKALETIAMNVDVMTYDPDDNGGWEGTPVEKLVRKYRRNGKLLESDARRFFPDKDGNCQCANYEFKNVWDGERYLSRQGSATYTTGFVSRRFDESKAIIYSTKIGNVLDGFFPHNAAVGNIIDLFMNQRESVTLRPSKERVGQYLCDVIEADTPSGKYVVWLDPGSGYCVRQAEVEIDSSDLAWGKPLKQRSRSVSNRSGARKYYQRMRWELRDVEVQKIGETFIPVSGSLIQDSFYADGSSSKVKFEYKRSDIDLAPDFEALGAFEMDMPAGTIVHDLDKHGVKYQWNGNGEMTACEQKKAE